MSRVIESTPNQARLPLSIRAQVFGLLLFLSERGAAIPANATLVPSSQVGPVGTKTLQAALREAADTWSYPRVACTSVDLSVAPPVGQRLAKEDGTNLVTFRTGKWCLNEGCDRTTTYPRRAAGMTTTYPSRAGPALIREADIELNGVTFDFGDARDSGRPYSADLTTVLIHELGHALGFPDRCMTDSGHAIACTPKERASVMNSRAYSKALSTFDIEELCRAYPRRSTPIASPSRALDARVGLGLSLLAGLGLAALVLRRRHRAAERSRYDGELVDGSCGRGSFTGRRKRRSRRSGTRCGR